MGRLRPRLTPWYLRPTPRFMRSWPFFRHYFWQPEEIVAIRREVERLRKVLFDETD